MTTFFTNFWRKMCNTICIHNPHWTTTWNVCLVNFWIDVNSEKISHGILTVAILKTVVQFFPILVDTFWTRCHRKMFNSSFLHDFRMLVNIRRVCQGCIYIWMRFWWLLSWMHGFFKLKLQLFPQNINERCVVPLIYIIYTGLQWSI